MSNELKLQKMLILGFLSINTNKYESLAKFTIVSPNKEPAKIRKNKQQRIMDNSDAYFFSQRPFMRPFAVHAAFSGKVFLDFISILVEIFNLIKISLIHAMFRRTRCLEGRTEFHFTMR